MLWYDSFNDCTNASMEKINQTKTQMTDLLKQKAIIPGVQTYEK